MGLIQHENLRIHLVVRDGLQALQKTFASFHQAASILKDGRDLGGKASAPWLKIFVYDDGSSPRSSDQIKKFLDRERDAWSNGTIRFERSAFPRGFCQGHNELLLLDPDSGGFLLVMLAGMEIAPDFFVHLQSDVLPLSADKPRVFLPRLRFHRTAMMGGEINLIRCVGQPRRKGPREKSLFYVGPAFVVPFRIFSRTLGWDPKMPAACAELELSWRMNEAQWGYTLATDLRLNHARKLRVLKDSRFFRSRMLLARRHLSGFFRRRAMVGIYFECAVQAATWLGMNSRPQEAIDLIKDTLSDKPI